MPDHLTVQHIPACPSEKQPIPVVIVETQPICCDQYGAKYYNL